MSASKTRQTLSMETTNNFKQVAETRVSQIRGYYVQCTSKSDDVTKTTFGLIES